MMKIEEAIVYAMVKCNGGMTTDQIADAMIRHMIESGESNTYQIIRHGKHKLLHQTPWYDEDGNVEGLIELAIDLPEEMPVFNRDKE